MSLPSENNLSTAALDGSGVLYLKNTGEIILVITTIRMKKAKTVITVPSLVLTGQYNS